MIRQLKLLWKWRELFKYMVISELKVQYKNRVLGYLWSILDPLLMMGVYVLLIGIILDRGGPQFPILLFSAILAWWWFTFSLLTSVTSISGKAKLIQVIYFPKAILPLQKVAVGFVRYLVGLTVLVPLLFLFEANLSLNLLWLPLLLGVQLLLTIGCCLIVAIIGVFFPDLQNIMRIAIRAMFFLSPALYSVADRIPERFQGIYMLNPFAALFESYKNILVRGLPPDKYMLIAFAIALILFIGGLILFERKEPVLAKSL